MVDLKEKSDEKLVEDLFRSYNFPGRMHPDWIPLYKKEFLNRLKGKIRIEIKSEGGMSSEPASVRVFKGDELVVEVTAEVELKPGADCGLYPCVTLKKK